MPHTNKLNIHALVTLSSLFLFIYLLVAPSNYVSAANLGNKSLSITLIGDSYTAGNGAGSYNGPRGSYQSSQNWGNRYAN